MISLYKWYAFIIMKIKNEIKDNTQTVEFYKTLNWI